MEGEAEALATIAILTKSIAGLAEGFGTLTKIATDHKREIAGLKQRLARLEAADARPARPSSILRVN
jgi:hypothetical protein